MLVSCILEATANINEYIKFHDAFNVKHLKSHLELHTAQVAMSAPKVLLALYTKYWYCTAQKVLIGKLK